MPWLPSGLYSIPVDVYSNASVDCKDNKSVPDLSTQIFSSEGPREIAAMRECIFAIRDRRDKETRGACRNHPRASAIFKIKIKGNQYPHRPTSTKPKPQPHEPSGQLLPLVRFIFVSQLRPRTVRYSHNVVIASVIYHTPLNLAIKPLAFPPPYFTPCNARLCHVRGSAACR